MTFPAAWFSVLLDEAADASSLARRLTELGMPASLTREGWLAFDGGLLGRVEPAHPSDLFAHPGALDGPSRAHAARLVLSGGALDADRQLFELRTSTRHAPEKTGRFLKLEQLAARMSALSPLGEGVVIPAAAYRFIPWTAWPREGAGSVFGAFVTLGRTGSEIVTRGLSLFGVPELGAAVEGDVSAVSRKLFDAAFEVAWRGFSPAGDAELTAFVDPAAGSWRLRRVARDGLFVADSASDARDFTLRANVASLCGSHLFDDPDGAEGDPAISVFAGADRRFAITVGLHRLSRTAGPVELAATSPRLSRVAVFALRQAAATLRAAPDGVGEYHRIAMPPLEPAGLAGVVLWPSGAIAIDASGASVTVIDVLPITPAELTDFRAGAQGAWMDRALAQRAFSQLHARWCGEIAPLP